IDLPEHFGFFLLALDGMESSKGFWVENYDSKISYLMQKFGESGCMASYKMRPWRLRINVIFKKKTIEVYLEPSWTVMQAIAFIATKNEYSLEDEYNMS